ncbi:MAG: GTPase ObgE [Anaerolineae bacterium]|jgi:GTP-binding protein|nr:GTPase ObgE [Anaerolineae bacterium]
MFYDQVTINVKAGKGGDGSAAFRREKYVPYGGPSGGDGGKGGDIILVVTPHLNTLYHFTTQKEFTASNGENGRNKDQYGANAEDLFVPVPPGTLVTEVSTGLVVADMTEPGQRVVVAKGGRGGRGNKHFVSSTNQAPRIAERGDPGEDRCLRLDLKLLADVGLVGKPNAGKSTLLSVTTAARPAIADYPFTTLQPNLGVVALDDTHTFVMTDLPGLIEGASEGKGLGLEFLRHIERTRLLIHLLDGTAPDPLEDFRVINGEMAAFGHGLIDKPQLVAVNKLDMPEARERFPELKKALTAQAYEVWGISGLTHESVRPLMGRAYQLLEEAPFPSLRRSEPIILEPEPLDEEFTLVRDQDGVWRVHGGKIERAVQRTNLNFHDSLLRLHGYLERKGVIAALRAAGVGEGDSVRIGDYELEWRDES